MGAITLKHCLNLYWLGRNAERAYTTLDTFFGCYDVTLDKDESSYREFLERLAVPDKYGDYDSFIRGYLYNDNSDGSSDGFAVSEAFSGMYDNALALKIKIGSEAFAYIQLARNAFYFSRGAKSLQLALMPAMDYLRSFWDIVDDRLANTEVGAIVKCGKQIERMDLYFRFSYDYTLIHREYEKLNHLLACVRQDGSNFYNVERLSALAEIMSLKELCRDRLGDALDCLGKLIEGQAA